MSLVVILCYQYLETMDIRMSGILDSMKYVEFIAREPAERSELLKTLPHEVLEDLCDEKPYPGAALKDEPGRTYFEDPDILREYLREHHVPASKPWEADRIMEHEGAHAKCALALGAVAVPITYWMKCILKRAIAYLLSIIAPNRSLI